MYEASLAQSGYTNSLQSTGDPRTIEYRVFAQVTRELSALKKDALDYPAKMAKALYENLRLWTILAADVANDNNQLPADLRSNLFYLAEFTRHHTIKVRAGEATPQALIDVNTMVMRGLRGRPATEAAE